MTTSKTIAVLSVDGQELHIPAHLIVGVVRCAYRDGAGVEKAAIQIVARTPPINMQPHQVYAKLAELMEPSPLISPAGGRPTIDTSLLNFDKPVEPHTPHLAPVPDPADEDEDSDEEHMFACTYCGELFPVDDMTHASGGNSLCAPCYNIAYPPFPAPDGSTPKAS